MGTWGSGITPAQHAGGPKSNPQCVRFPSASADSEGGRQSEMGLAQPSPSLA